jgi:hypothetical protein
LSEKKDGPVDTTAYTLLSRDETVEVPVDALERTTHFLDTCRRDPGLARQTLRQDEAFRAAAVSTRGTELVEIYEEARARGIRDDAALDRMEKRRSVAVYRDFLVLAVCRKAAFDLTHDPKARGQTLSDAFRVEASIAPVLDLVERDLFRARLTGGLGSQLLDDEEWEEGTGEEDGESK